MTVEEWLRTLRLMQHDFLKSRSMYSQCTDRITRRQRTYRYDIKLSSPFYQLAAKPTLHGPFGYT